MGQATRASPVPLGRRPVGAGCQARAGASSPLFPHEIGTDTIVFPPCPRGLENSEHRSRITGPPSGLGLGSVPSGRNLGSGGSHGHGACVPSFLSLQRQAGAVTVLFRALGSVGLRRQPRCTSAEHWTHAVSPPLSFGSPLHRRLGDLGANMNLLFSKPILCTRMLRPARKSVEIFQYFES